MPPQVFTWFGGGRQRTFRNMEGGRRLHRLHAPQRLLYLQPPRQNKYWMYETINEALRNSFYRDPDIEAALPDFERKVLGDRLSSFVAARKLLDRYFGDIRREK